MTVYRWDHPPHDPQADILDGDWGRYMVARVCKGSRTFAVYLNGQRTSYAGTREQMKTSVERILEQREIVKRQNEALTEALVPPIATPLLARLAVEWGYKQCEKGHNLEAAIRNFEELMKGGHGVKGGEGLKGGRE